MFLCLKFKKYLKVSIAENDYRSKANSFNNNFLQREL